MIYCAKKQEYVRQDEECIGCIFYKSEEDYCDYTNWIPGLKKGRDESNT